MSTKVTFWPSGKAIEVKPGTSLLTAARKAGVLIQTRCGGNAACFMCKVQVRPGSDLMPIADDERRKLAGLDEQGCRLACQAKARGLVEVDVPLDPLRAAVQKLLAKQAEESDDLW
ncbi:2Fe-2S iron-sulfur cluster-binding protein [Paenibacillus lupini]|jgi:2Fe-2S ferredoxin|uniref:2Fe-2S iron-sulfur cluster-binding protein n=1 Tax=Paenibacillus lupini TaxID=1450204 RepID=UPI00141DAA6E|nr:2Fe-2S iron-sulfur cluster-binding protein [Paenibacillus lupini]NIK21104.1 2Fe-2S ferredoxin [Paenibacillus lupini]